MNGQLQWRDFDVPVKDAYRRLVLPLIEHSMVSEPVFFNFKSTSRRVEGVWLGVMETSFVVYSHPL